MTHLEPGIHLVTVIHLEPGIHLVTVIHLAPGIHLVPNINIYVYRTIDVYDTIAVNGTIE